VVMYFQGVCRNLCCGNGLVGIGSFFMRTLAFGDIHGCYQSLLALWERVNPAKDDHLIMLGDYVDRGPQSKQVIDFLLEKKRVHTMDFLQGNHEVKMMLTRGYQNEFEAWIDHWDAGATMDSYGVTSVHDIPESHWEFLRVCKPYVELDRHIFVHACVEADRPISEQNGYTLVHKKFVDEGAHCSGKTVICGHTAQSKHRPLDVGHTICIDTDAGRDGWVTCLDVDTYDYWQANEGGESRGLSLRDL